MLCKIFQKKQRDIHFNKKDRESDMQQSIESINYLIIICIG